MATTWRVFKFADDRTDNAWREVGEIDVEYHTVYSDDIDRMGSRFGAGRFLLIDKDETYHVIEKRITQVPKFEEYELEDEELAQLPADDVALAPPTMGDRDDEQRRHDAYGAKA